MHMPGRSEFVRHISARAPRYVCMCVCMVYMPGRPEFVRHIPARAPPGAPPSDAAPQIASPVCVCVCARACVRSFVCVCARAISIRSSSSFSV